jgi:hypothetical protein
VTTTDRERLFDRIIKLIFYIFDAILILLELGKKLKGDEEGLYPIDMTRELLINKAEKILGYRFTAIYIDAVSKKVLWKAKL